MSGASLAGEIVAMVVCAERALTRAELADAFAGDAGDDAVADSLVTELGEILYCSEPAGTLHFSHAELRELASARLRATERVRAERRLLRWAARYQRRHWPAGTPGYLLGQYPVLLARTRPMEVQELWSDLAFVERATAARGLCDVRAAVLAAAASATGHERLRDLAGIMARVPPRSGGDSSWLIREICKRAIALGLPGLAEDARRQLRRGPHPRLVPRTVLDAESAAVTHRLDRPAPGSNAAITRDGTQVFSVSDLTLWRWRLDTGAREPLGATKGPGFSATVAVSGNGRVCAVAELGVPTARVWTQGGRQTVTVSSRPGDGQVTALAISGDGHTLLAASYDGTLIALDTRSWQRRRLRSPVERVTSLSAWRDRCVVVGADGSIHVLSVDDGRARALDTGGVAISAAVAAAEFQVTAVGSDGRLRRWVDLAAAPRIYECAEPLAAVENSPDGQTVVAASREGNIWVWRDGDPLARCQVGGHPDRRMPLRLALSGDGRRLVTCGELLQVWDVDRLAAGKRAPSGRPRAISMSEDGERVLYMQGRRPTVWRPADGIVEPLADLEPAAVARTGGWPTWRIKRWDLEGPSVRPVPLEGRSMDGEDLPHSHGRTGKAAANPDGTQVLLAEADGTISHLTLDADTVSYAPPFPAELRPKVLALRLNPTPAALIQTHTPRQWPPPEVLESEGYVKSLPPDWLDALAKRRPPPPEVQRWIVPLPDGAPVRVTQPDGWDVATALGSKLWIAVRRDRDQITIHEGEGPAAPVSMISGRRQGDVLDVVLAADGTWLAADSPLTPITDVWDTRSPSARHRRRLPGNLAGTSASGRWVVTREDGELRIWDTEQPGQPPVAISPNEWPDSVFVSDDGSRVITVTGPQILMWDLLDERPTDTDAAIEVAAISADGRRAVGAGRAGVLIWDLEVGAEVRTLDVPLTRVSAVGIGGSGNTVAVGRWDPNWVYDMRAAEWYRASGGWSAGWTPGVRGVVALQVARDRGTVVAVTWEGQLLRYREGRRTVLPVAVSPVLAVSPTGTRAITATPTGLGIHDLEAGSITRELFDGECDGLAMVGGVPVAAQGDEIVFAGDPPVRRTAGPLDSLCGGLSRTGDLLLCYCEAKTGTIVLATVE